MFHFNLLFFTDNNYSRKIIGFKIQKRLKIKEKMKLKKIKHLQIPT